MKPHVRKFGSLWFCGLRQRRINKFMHLDIDHPVGYGKTPVKAYQDYLTITGQPK